MDDASNHNFSDFVDSEDAALRDEYDDDEEEEEEGDEFCDVDTWETLSKRFGEVESVLDRNRRLIQQVNDNHRSKIPHNLTKNVDLICEINANMSKIIAIYSNLSSNLTTIVHQRQRRASADCAAKS